MSLSAEKIALKKVLETYGKQIDLDITRGVEATVIGNQIQINDAFKGDDHLLIVARSKNLLPFPYEDGSKATGDGLSFVVNDDGTITVSGNAKEDSVFTLYESTATETMPAGISPGKNYSFLLTNQYSDAVCYMDFRNAEGERCNFVEIVTDEIFWVPLEATACNIWISIPAGSVFDSCVLTPQITEGTTLTEYTPYNIDDFSSIKVSIFDENAALKWEANLDAAGTADHFKTLSPVTNIICNSDDVILEAIYKKQYSYTSEDIVSCTISHDGELLSAIMKEADIELAGVGGPDFAENIKGEKLFIKLVAKGGETTAEREYGTFIVKEAEYKDETNSVVLTCYDLMLLAMTEYNPIIEPGKTMSLYDYFETLCADIGLKFEITIYPNMNVEIDGEKFDESYTKRDVLTQIAQAAGGTIAIKNDKACVLFPKASGAIVEPSNLKTIEIGELFGPVNSVVIARTPQEDNIYKKDETAEKICEIKIENNQLMDSHREDFIDGLYEALKGLTYYPHRVESFGIGILDICDLFTIETLDGKTYTSLHLSGEVKIDQGIVETTEGAAPASTGTEYKAASESDRVLNKTILRVDKQEQTIQALITKTESSTNNLTGQVEEITRKLEQTATPEQVELIISETVSGIDSITTSTGYTLNQDGLRIKKSGDEIENLVDNTGMYVNREDDNVLTANAEGVQAINLTSKQYLIVGKNSRFEDYEENRTACFYIGG